MSDAGIPHIAVGPEPSSTPSFSRRPDSGNHQANEHAEENPRRLPQKGTTHRIPRACGDSRSRQRDGLHSRPSQHIVTTRANRIPYWNISRTGGLGVGNDDGSSGILNITGGGKVSVDSTTASNNRVSFGDGGSSGLGTGELNISGAGSLLEITSDSSDASLSIASVPLETNDSQQAYLMRICRHGQASEDPAGARGSG